MWSLNHETFFVFVFRNTNYPAQTGLRMDTCLVIMDFSQFRKDYGRDQADVIMNITGNIVRGQVTGDTVKQLSERFIDDHKRMNILSDFEKSGSSRLVQVRVTKLLSGVRFREGFSSG